MNCLLCLLCLFLCALPCWASSARYRITPLPGLNIWNGNAFLNNNGMVACGDKVWWKGHTWTIHNPLHNPRYGETDASGINGAGMVIGTFHGTEDNPTLVAFARVFVWQKGHVLLLPPISNSEWSVPDTNSINNAGNILVSVILQSPNPETVEYKNYLYHAGQYQSLSDKSTLRVNSEGNFVAVPMLKSVAPLSGEIYELHSVNGKGMIVGQYQSKNIRACVWQKGRCYDIGLHSDEASNAFALNNRGQVVGEFDTGQDDKNRDAITRAFVWQNRHMTDLNTLLPARSGWVLTEADAINDRGQIVCAGNKGACLLTPITSKRRKL